MAKIYTRTGDEGDTGLPDGSRASKHDELICALGDIDELNTCIGVLRAEGLPDDMDACMRQVQLDLFELGAEVADPGYLGIDHARVEALERGIDEMTAALPPLRAFILPGGGRAAALCHQARAVCRRAERALVACSMEYEVSIEIGRYINRLSDYLFVAGRALNHAAGREEDTWVQEVKGE